MTGAGDPEFERAVDNSNFKENFSPNNTNNK